MTISLNLSDEEFDLVKSYAEMNGLGVSEYVRQSVLECIEDECDIKAYEKAYEEYENSGRKSAPFDEL